MKEARRAAQKEGVALNQLINVAVAEKLSTLRAEMRFRRLASRADRQRTLEVLKRAGNGNPPIPGDEIPTSQKRPSRKRPAAMKSRKSAARTARL
jgi:hypothetical protein